MINLEQRIDRRFAALQRKGMTCPGIYFMAVIALVIREAQKNENR